MAILDMNDPAVRAAAVANGSIWSAPQGAIVAALKDIAAGRIPPPLTIPDQFVGLAASYGVEAQQVGGLADGQGPA